MLFAVTLYTVLLPGFLYDGKDPRDTRSELDLVKEGVTVDVLDNKSLMEPRLVILRELMRFCQFYFKLVRKYSVQ